MNSIEKKLKLLKYDSIDISTDEFYFLILKIEEEKIRLYKPKEREKLNYQKEKNYIEHIIKYLKKLNIDTSNINKQCFGNLSVRTYILNCLTTLALIDEYKDLVDFDEQQEEEEERQKEQCGDNSKTNIRTDQLKEEILHNSFELEYAENRKNEEIQKQEQSILLLNERINQLFKRWDIPLLGEESEGLEEPEKSKEVVLEKRNDGYNNNLTDITKQCNNNNNNYNNNKNYNNCNIYEQCNANYKKLCFIISALSLIEAKLKKKKKVENANYDDFFKLNITVKNKESEDYVCIIKYLFNNLLRNRKKKIKNVLNDIQNLTYNPSVDIKQGKVGK